MIKGAGIPSAGFKMGFVDKPAGAVAGSSTARENADVVAIGDMNCTPFVRQYGILDNKWGDLLCQKEYQTRDTRQNSSNW